MNDYKNSFNALPRSQFLFDALTFFLLLEFVYLIEWISEAIILVIFSFESGYIETINPSM